MFVYEDGCVVAALTQTSIPRDGKTKKVFYACFRTTCYRECIAAYNEPWSTGL